MLVFIVIIIGGLGSVGGCFVGSILVGLMANYVGFLAPKLALVSNILLMALVLLWRPQGLFPVAQPMSVQTSDAQRALRSRPPSVARHAAIDAAARRS